MPTFASYKCGKSQTIGNLEFHKKKALEATRLVLIHNFELFFNDSLIINLNQYHVSKR